MIYKEKFKIGLKDVWSKNEVSNVAILEYLEDIGAYHSDSVGYGINTVEQTHLNWILLDWQVKVLKRPKYGMNLEIHTWSRKVEKFYAYRDFEIYNDKKELCVISTSKLLLINSKTGKISRVEDEMAKKYESENKYVFKEEIEKIKLPEKFEAEIKYTVQRKDIDVIGHMHNLYYLNLAYEALPEEEYQKRPFDNVRIMYKKEIKLGETVVCKYAKEVEKEESENEGKEIEKNIIAIESLDGTIIHAIIEIY